jgi:hypothetical protein
MSPAPRPEADIWQSIMSEPKESFSQLVVALEPWLQWRLNVYWFFEERDHGVYIECEAVSLRDLPFGSANVAPIVQSIPAESLRGSLEQTQKAIAAEVKY